MIYGHGGQTDTFMMRGGSVDVLGQMVALIKAEGVPAGVGSHSLNMPIECEKAGIDNDFYFKTFHGDKYWSATEEENREEYDWMRGHPFDHNKNHDAMWCNNPEETAAFMEKVKKPWIAFKVMAAGAIPPRTAFRYAFENGADFIVAGMFDFQVEADVRTAIDAIEKAPRGAEAGVVRVGIVAFRSAKVADVWIAAQGNPRWHVPKPRAMGVEYAGWMIHRR